MKEVASCIFSFRYCKMLCNTKYNYRMA